MKLFASNLIWFDFHFNLLVTCGYLVVSCGYLVVTSGYLIATTGYFWLLLVTFRYFSLLLVPRFSNNEHGHWKRSCWCFDLVVPRICREWLHFIISLKRKRKRLEIGWNKDVIIFLVEKTKKFQNPFSILGENWEVSNDLFIILELVCQHCGCRKKSSDRVRFQIYDKKCTKDNKEIDMAAVPPCISVLWLHILKSNMVASLWKRSTTASSAIPDITQHGRDLYINTHWAEDVFPKDVEDILLHEEYENLDEYLDENDGESDVDDEEDY